MFNQTTRTKYFLAIFAVSCSLTLLGCTANTTSSIENPSTYNAEEHTDIAAGETNDMTLNDKNDENDKTADTNNTNATEANSTNSEYPSSIIDTVKDAIENQNIIPDLEAALKETIGDKQIVDFCIDDFDLDGTYEAFSLVGDMEEDDGSCHGTIYYITESSIDKVVEDAYFWPYDKQWHELTFDTAKFYLTGFYATTGDSTYVFGVKDHKWYESSMSLRGMSLTQIDETNLQITHSTYDNFADGSGHTWKTYYLYWDNGFHEYGGIEISEDELKMTDGGSKLIDDLNARNAKISKIYYRENGIININYTIDDENCNTTAKLDGTKLTLLEVEAYSDDAISNSNYGGIYKSALLEDIATYPDTFPLSK